VIIRVWRVTKKKFAAIAFSGEGAFKFGGRWNSVGTALVYTSQSLSLATLEILTGGIQISLLNSFVTIRASFDSSLVDSIPITSLPREWCDYPYSVKTQKIGDSWVKEMKSAVLKLPSTVIKGEFNYLINPLHPDFKKISLEKPEDFVIDKRFVREQL
jgi:RES domain-containing protein